MSITHVEIDGKKIRFVMDREMLSYLSESIGCYYCEQTFISPQVSEFTGNGEPLCPHCGVDAVVRTTETADLSGLHKKYFGRSLRER